MTKQALETEGKTLNPDLILAGVTGLINQPHYGTYYVAVDQQ